MKKTLAFLSMATVAAGAFAQSVPAAEALSRHDLRGTARFMSMGGAFGALGGDLSVLSQNPGGIGVYRNSDVGITLGIDALSSNATSNGFSQKDNMTKFNLNNIGIVYTLRLGNSVMPNINFGFTYNKVASFNRRFKGVSPNLGTSYSNYLASLANAGGYSVADYASDNSYDPYFDSYIPWNTIVGYDSYLINNYKVNDQNGVPRETWLGQYEEGTTTGTGYYEMYEHGSIDEYNIAVGGNINNIVYWGADLGVTTVDYKMQSVWGESLDDAYVYNPNSNQEVQTYCDWDVYDNYRLKGAGVNVKLGVIVKPIQELRLGLAVHTPTYYTLDESSVGSTVVFDYPFSVTDASGYKYNNCSTPYFGPSSIDFRTPWRVIASVAGVIGNSFILSADYEWEGYNGMRYSYPSNYWDDPWYDDPWYDYSTRGAVNGPVSYGISDSNSLIKDNYKNTNTVRVGAEYRVLNWLSLRAGYSWSSSPVKTEAKRDCGYGMGTELVSAYTLNNNTMHATCGAGIKFKGFYADLAYVYKYNTAEYFPYTPDIYNIDLCPKAHVEFERSQVALTLGYKF